MIPRSRRIQSPPAPQQQIGKLAEGRINEGMITSIDSADIPNGALALAKNAVIRFDKTIRRAGSVLLAPVKPNSEPVIRIAFIKTKDGSPYTLRFTPSTIHIRGTTAWNAITITTPLAGTIFDRISTANVIDQTPDLLDNFVFANNGANKIQKIDFPTATCADLGNSANYRYVVGFFNRIIGLARRGVNEVEVGWSADGVPDQWDPLVNNSAGSTPLFDSPADLSDFITGGLSFSNVMAIMRQKSIWLATKQPIAQDPFYFYSAVPGIGMDCSYSLQLVNNGIAWVDTRTRDVWAYTPNGAPERLAFNIKKDLFNDIDNSPNGPKSVFSSFSTIPSEYTIYIPVAGNITKAWTYNFEYKAWTYNEFVGVTCAENVEIASAFITIDELLGAIDDLPGTIDELSPSTSIDIPFSYGRNDGTIAVSDEETAQDAPHFNFPLGINFDTDLRSKVFVLPEDNINVHKINIEYIASRTTLLNLYYSKDEGKTWIFLKHVSITKFNQPVILALRKVIRARRFQWRLLYNSSDMAITNYEVFVTTAGDTQMGE